MNWRVSRKKERKNDKYDKYDDSSVTGACRPDGISLEYAYSVRHTWVGRKGRGKGRISGGSTGEQILTTQLTVGYAAVAEACGAVDAVEIDEMCGHGHSTSSCS